jgi:hypothetical protein
MKEVRLVKKTVLGFCGLVFIVSWGLMLFGCGAPAEQEADWLEAKKAARLDAYQAWERGEGEPVYLEPEWLAPPAELDGLGQLEQPFAAKHTPNYQLGVDSSHARMQCTRTNPAQTCSIITTKSILFYIEPADFGPPGTGYNDEIYTYVSQLDGALSSWSFTETFDPATPNIVLVFRRAACSGSFSSSSISAFSCMTLVATGANLTEGDGVTGFYTTHLGATVWIDMGDITQRATTTIRRLRLLRHAAGHGTLGAIGFGGRTDAGADAFVSRMLVDVDWSGATISSGEDCRAESYDATSNGVFNRLQPSCGGAD